MMDLTEGKYDPAVRLAFPTVNMESAYRQLISDWESEWENVVPWILREDASDFPAWVEKLEGFTRGEGVKETFVPNSTYFLLDAADQIVGVVNIRHYLNDRLRLRGGHIGYGVPPSQRGKGYATQMLALALIEARRLGVEDALLTIYPDNEASRKVILNNGGQALGMVVFEGEELEQFSIKRG